MGVVKFVGSKSEAEILALTSASPLWYDLGFYYPNDTPSIPYFYRLVNGVMVKYATGVGVTLSGEAIGGVKSLIESGEVLDIPENYEYNIHELIVEGSVNVNGKINML